MGKRRESFEAVQRSVVRVKDADGQTWGTGFFISREGHLLTCAHVVQDAGGWKNVRISDQPVNCLYEGDPERDDFCLLQVEDLQVTPVELGKDFDPGDDFLSFGFSNDDFYGAPIQGEITAFARCGKLGDQKLIRLETFSDAQRIEGGQSGAPIFVYKRRKYKAVGLIVASEDLSGGLAIPSSKILEITSKYFSKHLFSKISLPFLISLLCTTTVISVGSYHYLKIFRKCSSETINGYANVIKSSLENQQYRLALQKSNELLGKCPKNHQGYYYKGASLTYLGQYDDAIEAYNALVKINNSPNSIYALGLAYMRAKKYDDAIKKLSSLLEDKSLNTFSIAEIKDVKYNLGLSHQQLARSEMVNTNSFRDSKKVFSYLKKAEAFYTEVIDATKDYCNKSESGSCYSDLRALSADNLVAIYSQLYSMDNKNKYYLSRAISTIEIAFISRSQQDREQALRLYTSSTENEVLEDINIIRDSPEFRSLMESLKRRYRL